MKSLFSIFSLLIVAVVLFSSFSCNKRSSGSIPPVTSAPEMVVDFIDSDALSPVLEQAEAEGKLVFVDFYTDWCLPCRVMDRDVFTDQPFGDWMNDNFISYKVNAEKDNGPRLSSIFEVQVFPTLLFLDAKGNVLERRSSSMSTTQLRAMGQRVLDAN